MTEDAYPIIELESELYKISFQIRNPSMAQAYRENPDRVEKYLKAYLASAVSDVIVGEGLDSIINAINLEAAEKKVEVLQLTQRLAATVE